MKAQTYTPKQVEAADRLIDAVASVPSEKQPAFVRFIEAIAIGANVALGNSSAATAGN